MKLMLSPEEQARRRALGPWLVPSGTPVWVDGVPLFTEEMHALLVVASAAVEYQQKHDAWMQGEVEGLAPTVLNEAEDKLFAALAGLPPQFIVSPKETR